MPTRSTRDGNRCGGIVDNQPLDASCTRGLGSATNGCYPWLHSTATSIRSDEHTTIDQIFRSAEDSARGGQKSYYHIAQWRSIPGWQGSRE
jgi:hypothetical protein